MCELFDDCVFERIVLQCPFQIGETRRLTDGEKALICHANSLLQEVQRDRIISPGFSGHVESERCYASDLCRIRFFAVVVEIPGILDEIRPQANLAVLTAKQINES